MKTIFALALACGFACHLRAQLNFSLSSSVAVGLQPQFIAAGDVNGNGKQDLITVSQGNNAFTVLTNDGRGGFSLSSSLNAGNDPSTDVAIDLNGDGKIDLVSANYGANTLAIWTNNGTGGFAASSSPTVGVYPISVTSADINGDGWPDLISGNSGSASVSILTNNGSGGFAPAGAYPVGINPWCVVAADVNGDGWADVISANYADSTLTVLTNDGSGGFATSGTYPVGANPRAVAAADFNGDGSVDLVSVNLGSSTLTVLTNNGSGGFLFAATYPVGNSPVFVTAADLNGDGRVDLITANFGASTLTVLTNNGVGGFVLAGTFAVGTNPRSVVAVDVNGDGKLDLASVNQGSNSVSILTNGTAFPLPSIPIITTQPAGQTNLVGTTAAFSVSAKALLGVQQFAYQWRLNGTNLPAATNNIVALPNVSLSQAGTYDVVITNYSGSVTSHPALLNVLAILVQVNGQPAGGSVSALLSAAITMAGFQGGFIFYTLDGTLPSANSIYYGGPFTLSNSVVLQAMTLSPDFTQTAYSTPINLQISAPLNLSTPGGGSLSVNGLPTSPASNYLTGASVTLAATPGSGWTFLGWQGSATGTNNPLSVTMSQTNAIQAIFGTAVATNVLGAGSIVLSQPNPVPFGTSLTASALANAGSYFLSWGGAASGTNAPAKFTVTSGNTSVSALFATLPPAKYSLSVLVAGNGFVTNSLRRSYYDPGDSVPLKAVTNGGAYFQGWTLDAAGTSSSVTVLMTTNRIVQANFGVLPFVSVTPTNSTVLAGANASLIANASSIPGLGYQWQNGFGPIIGATNSVYTLVNAQPTNAGSYWVVVANAFGSVTSAPVSVSVIGAPSILTQPSPVTVTVGHAANFVVSAYGSPAVAYQWQFNGTSLADATNASFTLSNAFPANAGPYAVAITNLYGSVTSNPTLLTILPLSVTLPAIPVPGQFQFTFDTALGVQYQIEYSTDLVNWYPWLDAGGVGQPLTLSDPNTAASPQRFYRVILSP